MSMFSVSGKTALVTGASRGLGRAVAVALAEAGADIVCASSSLGGTEDTASEIERHGRKAWRVAADLSNRSAATSLAQEVSDMAGDIDILVNNAGTIRRAPAVEYSLEDWDHVVQTNLNSVFVLCQYFGKRMVTRQTGKIINIASLLSFSGGITVPAYAASKHGIAGLTKALANEWAKDNVQVNAIAPGYFRTDNTAALQNDEVRNEQIVARIPAGEWGTPDLIGGPVVFLASSASDYVNGHILSVDGGWMAR
jgi:2-deoxy-D-gluconate 3-dehydrogenase